MTWKIKKFLLDLKIYFHRLECSLSDRRFARPYTGVCYSPLMFPRSFFDRKWHIHILDQIKISGEKVLQSVKACSHSTVLTDQTTDQILLETIIIFIVTLMLSCRWIIGQVYNHAHILS